eukprot:3529870-Pleurochrysis_carterae.AAC.5
MSVEAHSESLPDKAICRPCMHNGSVTQRSYYESVTCGCKAEKARARARADCACGRVCACVCELRRA